MTSAGLSGLCNVGLLPASLAALLNTPVDRVAMTTPHIGTLSVGSMFSYQPSS